MSSDQESLSSDRAVAEAGINGDPAVSAAGGSEREGQSPQQPQQQQRRSGWDILRTVLFQVMIFYFISSFFRGRQTPPANPDGTMPLAGSNLFTPGLELELKVYFTESEDFDFNSSAEYLIWEEGVQYGNWTDGPLGDGSRQKELSVSVPPAVQENGTWYIHIFMVKRGLPINPVEEGYKETAITYQSKLLNQYRKRRIHNTANLLTGESDVAPGSMKVAQGDTVTEADIISYYHPNITICLVEDYTRWAQGSVPQPLDNYIEFDSESGGYYPILYLNDYWNLAQDYMPINDTTKELTFTLAYHPLTLFKFNLYASMSRDNPWTQLMGGADTSDEDQDTIKTTLLETNPYLLALTVVVSIVHSVFEFLAFKNDVQFWRSRKTLEGLSVRSVFFNVFQSFVVLLYILDNETNTVVIISVFVGLCIELWKVTKVVQINVDSENLIAGVIPRISFVDRPSYESSTKEYDMLAFKYLGWVLFPLFLCYGVYSLLYQEHKGWYSFVLGMTYGFLLTFGFITMTPQLFINYKLKSVAHLPWRMLTYKALNTFIDDMFAFVIKMPTMYRIGCFRDDIVFFIYLYQRWIYRVDPKRVNEFGTSGEDANIKGAVTGENSAPDPSISAGESPPKSLEDKKNE